MKVEQCNINTLNELPSMVSFKPNVILCFSSLIQDEIIPFLHRLKISFPQSIIIGCSTGGNIFDNKISNHKISISLIEFEKSNCRAFFSNMKASKTAFENSEDFQKSIPKENLKHQLLFTTNPINGSDFIEGFQRDLDSSIKVTGGMAAMDNIEEDNYIIFDGKPIKQAAICLGIYGSGTKVSFGSHGGWDSFGIERKVTKSVDNILYEIDGQNALELYKSYLGDLVHKLPDIGIMFPISMRIYENDTPIVRSVMNMDEKNQSLIFAGNIPINSSLKLMKANVDRLISGAEKSAIISTNNRKIKPNLAILISCRGRLGVLKQLAEEELEIVKEVLGEDTFITGFYSDGEFAPTMKNECSVLHNQTMTITTFTE